MKVCTICDRFIGPDNESFISIDDLKNKYKSHFDQDLIDDVYDVGLPVIKTLNKYYTQKHFVAAEDEWLKKLILSPRSYGNNPKNKKQKKKLGCCKECKNALYNSSRRKDTNGHPCKFAIINGLMIGTAPRCIEALNDVELAMLSKGRCEKHIFSYTAGAHSQIRGFHTIYQNMIYICFSNHL